MKASELKNLDVRELIDELNSLDFENVGGWPMPVKIGAAVLVFGFVLGLGYFLGGFGDSGITLVGLNYSSNVEY